MGTTPIPWFHSLKVKFTLLLLLGGLLVGVIGVWVTYKATDTQLEQRLLVRVGTLAGAVNHTAMAGSNWPVVQHMIEAIVAEEPDIRNVIVVGSTPARILAASSPGIRGTALADLKDDHLRLELSQALETGVFGSHFEPDHHPDQAGNLVVIAPLLPDEAQQAGHDHASPDHSTRGHATHSHATHDHDHGETVSPPAGGGPALDRSAYRGAIMIVASKGGVVQGVHDVLWRYILLLVVGTVVILRIAYLALNSQVLRPLSRIQETINRRKSGDSEARVPLVHHDEVTAVAQTLNETLDREDAQGRQLTRVNEQLSQAVVTAEAANVAKSSFLANMSHELRTPLNAIIGFSDIMKTETLGPVGSIRYKEYSEDINQAGIHLLNLINDLLDLSKIEAEKDELCEGDVDVQRSLQSALKLVQQRAEKGDVALVLDTEQGLPCIRADERKLKQVFTNLLTNAIKFTEPGGSVTAKTRCRGDFGFVFQIIDTGIGMEAADIPKALSQFGQVDSDLDRKYEGSGLGLPLTKALVELHGGTLELESEVGTGTIVTVRLPAWRIVSEKIALAR